MERKEPHRLNLHDSEYLSDQIEQRAKDLEQRGIKALDAVHLASAEDERVDYFCSCDDRLVKKAKALSDVAIKIVTPLELVQELDQ